MVWKVHLRWCRTTLKTWVTHVYHLQSSIKNIRSGGILMCKTVQTDCGGIKSLKTMLSLSASWLGVRAPKSNNTPGGGPTRTNKNIFSSRLSPNMPATHPLVLLKGCFTLTNPRWDRGNYNSLLFFLAHVQPPRQPAYKWKVNGSILL